MAQHLEEVSLRRWKGVRRADPAAAVRHLRSAGYDQTVGSLSGPGRQRARPSPSFHAPFIGRLGRGVACCDARRYPAFSAPALFVSCPTQSSLRRTTGSTFDGAANGCLTTTLTASYRTIVRLTRLSKSA